MSSLRSVGRSAATLDKDRKSLCRFTFSDGRQCRTPRVRNHPHFCGYHAQKEARAQAADTLGKDLAYFFSGNYLSACDLSAALGCLLPAVVRGDIKPRSEWSRPDRDSQTMLVVQDRTPFPAGPESSIFGCLPPRGFL